MTTMTQQMQPTIGATGLMALNQSNEIASRYRDTTGISASETDVEEQAHSVSITDRTPIIGKFAGKWVNHILHKYRLLKPLAAGADWYDEKNRQYATKQFDMALANGPKTKEGRQGLAYKTWGYLCDSGHDLLDLGSNIAGLYSFYLDVTQGLAVVLAPFTEGASLIALPELKTTQGFVDILSTHLAVSATEAHGAFLDYQAVKTQDGVGSVASIESQYQENTTDRIFAYAAWALKTFKFLSPKKQISTVRQAGSFQSRAEQWISRMTTFVGSKIGEHWPGFSKVGAWVQSLSKIYGYVKKIKSVGENIWTMAKDPALLLWKTAKFGLDVGKHAAIGAQHLGRQAIYYAAEKVKSGAGWLQNKASALAHFTGDKAQSAVKWMLPHFGGDGTKPLLIASMLGESGEPVTIADGGKTGPFYPKDWKGKTYSSAEAALEDSSRIAVYVNGVQTPLKRHRMAAQELAQQIGKPVVGIYNASGSAPQDFGQCATDKFGILGMGRRNAAITALAKVISQHGSPAEKNGGLDLYAHSQGSIIVSEAIRQAKGQGHDVRGLDVTTFGNATWSRPEGLRGYHNYVYDSDVIATGGGSSSLIGALLRTRSNKSNPLNPFLGGQGMTSTADDTFTLHHRGAGARPHGIIPDPLPGTDGLDSEDYYLKSLPKFRAKESATRAHLAALGPVGGLLESEALNRAMVTRSLAATSFAFAKSAGGWMAGKTESAYDAASGLVKSGYDSAADLVQTGYRKTEGLAERGYTGAAHSVSDTYSEGAGGVAAGYGRMDGWMRRLPSLPFLQPNAVWGALDRTFRTGGSAVDSGLRGGGAMLDHGLQRLGKTGDMRLRGAGAVADFAARAGGSLTDRSLRRTGSGVAEAGRRGASAVDDYFDSTNAIQRKGRGDHPEVNPTALRAGLHKHSSGFLPDSNIRAKLGGHLGFDPGGARLHTGPAAAQASRALNAEAFTIGNDVFFGEGRFDPHTPKGLGLIAHELTHVGQQTGTTGNKARFFTEQGGDDMEREAQQTGESVLANAGSPSGLFVESYVRDYEGEGGLSHTDQQRLDRISVLALTEAQRLLERQGQSGVNLDALDVQVEIDLSEMSDGEAARVWAEAIMTALPQRVGAPRNGSETQRVQRSDPNQPTSLPPVPHPTVGVPTGPLAGDIANNSPAAECDPNADPTPECPGPRHTVGLQGQAGTGFQSMPDRTGTNNIWTTQYALNAEYRYILDPTQTRHIELGVGAQGAPQNAAPMDRPISPWADPHTAYGYQAYLLASFPDLASHGVAHFSPNINLGVMGVTGSNVGGYAQVTFQDLLAIPVWPGRQLHISPILQGMAGSYLSPGGAMGSFQGSVMTQLDLFRSRDVMFGAFVQPIYGANFGARTSDFDAVSNPATQTIHSGSLVGGFYVVFGPRPAQSRHQTSDDAVHRKTVDGMAGDTGPQEQAAHSLEEAVIAGMSPSAGPMEAFTSPLRIQRKPAALSEHLASAYFSGNSILEQIYHGAPALQRGSHNKAVSAVQQALSDLNFRLSESGVDGDFGKETEAAVQNYQAARSLDPDGKVGPDTLRALEADLNTAPKAAPEIAATDSSLGAHVASDMNAANTQEMNTHNTPAADSGVWYQYNYRDAYPKKWNLDLLKGYASPIFFDRIAGMDWRLKPKRSASAAVKAWLKGLTIAECNSAVTAMEWDALRAALGDKKFDEHFGAEDKDIPEDQRLRINTKFRATPLAQYMKKTDAAKAGNAGTENNRPAKIGEWYYFSNHPQYLLKHPGGAWQGENSIFMGVNADGKQLWAGLGASNVTEKGMYQEMIDAYNEDRGEDDYRALRQRFPDTDPQKHPEQLPDEYREGSGVFPSVIGVADVLSAPPYTIGETTRTGGFVADAGITLDTAKVQQTRNEP